jgi:hypothetical protein
MTLQQLQADMRRGYIWGAPGVVVSGLVWLAAGLVAALHDERTAVWTLFIGASFIFPIGTLVDRLLGAPGTHTAGNPLGRLAMEGTIWMLMCLPAAYLLSLYRMTWFFPAVLMVIGGRYLTFATLYGTMAYWGLGVALGGAAMAGVMLTWTPSTAALTGAAIEIVFGTGLYVWQRGRETSP